MPNVNEIAASLAAINAAASEAAAPVAIVPDAPAKPERSNVAAKPAKPAKRKLAVKRSGKAAKPADKPEAAKPATDKPVEIHGLSSSYRGASPVFRGHARKLSPIVLGRVAARYTDRDHAALKAAYAAFGTKPFPAYDTDRGIISRLEAHGLLRHVSGDLSFRDCKFAVTDRAVKTKLGKAAAPKA